MILFWPEPWPWGSGSFVLGVGVGRGNWRLRCWVCALPQKIRCQFHKHKHTSLIFLAVYSPKLNFRFLDFCELRIDGILRRFLPEKWLPGIYIAPCATAIVPAGTMQEQWVEGESTILLGKV